MVGTPPYMAPELAALRAETAKYGKPVDIWAMGVVLYILLSGIHPFQIEDEEQMLDNIQRGKWSWLGPYWAKISKDAQDLIRHMLDLSSETRFTVDQCLTHVWFNDASAESLGDVAAALKDYQAKKRLKGAILGIMAAGKMKNLVSALRASGTTGVGAATTTATPAVAAPPPPEKHAAPKTTAVAQRLQKGTKLEITVIGGKELASRDANGKSDPYLRLLYGQTRLKTTIQKKTLHPAWKNEVFLIPLDENDPTLRVQCWDWNLIGSDETMGEFTIDLRKFQPNTPVTAWYSLAPEEGKKKSKEVKGSIQLTIQICK